MARLATLGGAAAGKLQAALYYARKQRLQRITDASSGEELLAFGTPLYWVGDSITDFAYSPLGYSSRTLYKTKGRYQTPPAGNRGSAGQNSNFAVRDMPMLLSVINDFGPGVVHIMLGTNVDGEGFAQTITNINTLCDAYIGAGCRVIVAITPHSASTDIDDLVASMTARGDVTVLRTDTAITNTGAGDQSLGMTYDSTHYNDEGSEVHSDLLVAVLDGWSEDTAVTLYTDDVASLIDGSFTGSGGTISTGATGQMPDGWSIARIVGDGSATATLVEEDGELAVEIAITAIASNTQFRVARNYSATPNAIDDHFEAWFGFRQVSGILRTVNQQMDGNNVGSVGGAAAYNNTRMTDSLVMRSGNIKPRNATGSTFTNYIFFTAAAGQTAVFRIWQPRMVKRTVVDYAPIPTILGGVGAHPDISPVTAQPVGTLYTANARTWYGKPLPITFTYQWLRDGVAIEGATASTYTSVLADQGTQLSCEITGTNTTGANSWVTAEAAAVT